MNAQPAFFKVPPQVLTESFHIRLLGSIWQPGFDEVGGEFTIGETNVKRSGDTFAGDLWIGPDMTDLEAVEAWMSTNTGDFSRIIDYEIIHHEKRVRMNAPTVDGWRHTETWTRDRTIRAWSDEENEMKCLDSLSPFHD